MRGDATAKREHGILGDGHGRLGRHRARPLRRLVLPLRRGRRDLARGHRRPDGHRARPAGRSAPAPTSPRSSAASPPRTASATGCTRWARRSRARPTTSSRSSRELHEVPFGMGDRARLHGPQARRPARQASRRSTTRSPRSSGCSRQRPAARQSRGRPAAPRRSRATSADVLLASTTAPSCTTRLRRWAWARTVGPRRLARRVAAAERVRARGATRCVGRVGAAREALGELPSAPCRAASSASAMRPRSSRAVCAAATAQPWWPVACSVAGLGQQRGLGARRRARARRPRAVRLDQPGGASQVVRRRCRRPRTPASRVARARMAASSSAPRTRRRRRRGSAGSAAQRATWSERTLRSPSTGRPVQLAVRGERRGQRRQTVASERA